MKIEATSLSFSNKRFSTFSNTKGVPCESFMTDTMKNNLKKSAKERLRNIAHAKLSAKNILLSKNDNLNTAIKPIKNYNSYMKEYGLK